MKICITETQNNYMCFHKYFDSVDPLNLGKVEGPKKPISDYRLVLHVHTYKELASKLNMIHTNVEK